MAEKLNNIDLQLDSIESMLQFLIRIQFNCAFTDKNQILLKSADFFKKHSKIIKLATEKKNKLTSNMNFKRSIRLFEQNLSIPVIARASKIALFQGDLARQCGHFKKAINFYLSCLDNTTVGYAWVLKEANNAILDILQIQASIPSQKDYLKQTNFKDLMTFTASKYASLMEERRFLTFEFESELEFCFISVVNSDPEKREFLMNIEFFYFFVSEALSLGDYFSLTLFDVNLRNVWKTEAKTLKSIPRIESSLKRIKELFEDCVGLDTSLDTVVLSMLEVLKAKNSDRAFRLVVMVHEVTKSQADKTYRLISGLRGVKLVVIALKKINFGFNGGGLMLVTNERRVGMLKFIARRRGINC